MNATTKIILIISAILGCIYISLLSAAANGYGYMGHNGYHGGPSFWYFGGPSTYSQPSNRSGSVNGTKRIGGGPGSGK